MNVQKLDHGTSICKWIHIFINAKRSCMFTIWPLIWSETKLPIPIERTISFGHQANIFVNFFPFWNPSINYGNRLFLHFARIFVCVCVCIKWINEHSVEVTAKPASQPTNAATNERNIRLINFQRNKCMREQFKDKTAVQSMERTSWKLIVK